MLEPPLREESPSTPAIVILFSSPTPFALLFPLDFGIPLCRTYPLEPRDQDTCHTFGKQELQQDLVWGPSPLRWC
jgi:hypothetical protein